MKMFDNYDSPEAVIPDNLVCFLDVQGLEWDAIGLGATNTHYFKLSVGADDIKNYTVSYRQGLSIILEKLFGEGEFETVDEITYLKVVVTPEESRLFNSYNKDTSVQLALMLLDDEIVYSALHRLKIIGSINSEVFEIGND